MSSTPKKNDMKSPAKSRQELAKEKQQELKTRRDAVSELQKNAYGSLPVGGLFIALFVSADPHQSDAFHWGIYHHATSFKGTKYHITGSAGRWIAAHSDARNTFKSQSLSVLVQIGQIPQSATDQLDQIMKSHDHELNNLPGLTCRVWVFTVVEKLVAAGLLTMTGTTSTLEDECKAYGNQLSSGDAQKDQPRPVVRSAICS
ncbi:uncharacterized protein RCC_03464 [Ramularia collo-cygni]|uniref:Uncharacterized protein n=1 Tax=Ramularia collo-cygni TaxID=112498 RepID=A0A2D3UZ20_9PEZI|nr:uncharacterized protein RCC_03464 [Ramularia collo-cygni]CZT17627.1 uncharacterized protein RCC_03464 [Ramularia collo-cygni]